MEQLENHFPNVELIRCISITHNLFLALKRTWLLVVQQKFKFSFLISARQLSLYFIMMSEIVNWMDSNDMTVKCGRLTMQQKVAATLHQLVTARYVTHF